MAAQADIILNKVYQLLNIDNATHEQKYLHIDDIIHELANINQKAVINPKTTGTISERLCQLALKARVDNIYKPMNDKWNWMADFSILGHPFNLLVSVKSFKAKERLLVSGSGNILSPTVGWGLMNDQSEWTEERTRTYLFRSFIAIYMPGTLYNNIPQSSKDINNINGKPFLRSLPDFTIDLTASISNGVIDITKF